jgi:hypothetical protein
MVLAFVVLWDEIVSAFGMELNCESIDGSIALGWR